MMRGWIIAGVLAGCTASTVLAQDGAGARSRQQLAQAHARQRQNDERYYDTRYFADSQVQQAAAAAEVNRSQPFGRTTQRTPKKSSSGGIFSKLHLPSLFPSSRNEQEVAAALAHPRAVEKRAIENSPTARDHCRTIIHRRS
jgi:hypothetical protein